MREFLTVLRRIARPGGARDGQGRQLRYALAPRALAGPVLAVATAAVAGCGGAAAPGPDGTLAERIRALQYHASRARQQGA